MNRQYNIAFLGLGSIGKRHFGNVVAFLEGRGDTCSIDLYRSDITKPLPNEIASKVNKQYLYSESSNEIPMYDVVFVTNPTSIHYESILKFSNHTKAFFIEKPVFDSTNIDTSVFELIKNIPSYVACPLRYNPVLQYIKNNIDYKKACSVRAISSSYLPDWRPGQDYRKCYSAHRDMGGGVGIDLIHEWDYLTHFFGQPTKCYSIQEKISSLEIDSDDIAIYIAKTETTSIELHLDYFGRQSIRTLDLFMPDDTIHCDILNGTITYLKKNETIRLESDRNGYQMREIEHFFRIVDKEIENDSTVEHAFSVLKIAKGEN